MIARTIFTGSVETEDQLRKHLAMVAAPDEGAPLSAWDDDAYMLQVMTTGRCGPGQRREGSGCFDDTGGFFEISGQTVYLTQKALDCITF